MLTLLQQNASLMRVTQSAAMFGGFFLLLCEIRFEHREVLVEDWRPWIPIVFCGLMLVVIPLATWLWGRGGKKVLCGCYCLTMCLGLLGLVFHSEGHFIQRLSEIFSVWLSTLQDGAAIKAHHPPLLAPAAFAGLGAIGLLFCLEKKSDLPEKPATGGA
jgi:hypothetical protein